jgi:hypothetical protein
VKVQVTRGSPTPSHKLERAMCWWLDRHDHRTLADLALAPGVQGACVENVASCLKKHRTDHQHYIAKDREPETSSDRVMPRDGIGREPSREGPVADGHVDRGDHSPNSSPKSQASPRRSSQSSEYQRSQLGGPLPSHALSQAMPSLSRSRPRLYDIASS